jgi:hypothetical protein
LDVVRGGPRFEVRWVVHGYRTRDGGLVNVFFMRER